jgi:hypothetical protein
MMGLRLFGHGCGADGLGFVPPKHSLRSPRVRFAKMLSAASALSMTMIQRSGGGGARPLWGNAPIRGGRSADKRWCGTPHPVARLTAKPVPSAEGNGRPMTRTGAPIGAPPRRFPSSPGPPSGNGQGRPFTNALDSTGFPPLHPLPPARCRTDPHSWAGRCLPRPPEARLARPRTRRRRVLPVVMRLMRTPSAGGTGI